MQVISRAYSVLRLRSVTKSRKGCVNCRVTALYPRPKGARFYGDFDKLYSGRFDIDPIFVDFNGQCHPEDGSRVFYNRGEDNLYYLVNWEQYTSA